MSHIYVYWTYTKYKHGLMMRNILILVDYVIYCFDHHLIVPSSFDKPHIKLVLSFPPPSSWILVAAQAAQPPLAGQDLTGTDLF